MFVFAKIWFLSCVLSSFVSSSYSSVIPAAVIRRHTVTYKDVPVDSYKPIQHPVIYIPSSMVNLLVNFKSKSSKVHVKQEHKSNAGQMQYSKSEDEPHYLRHEVKRPVIQTVREVIVPYRRVIQQIKPVVEDVKTIVATGVPKSSVYMNFGPKYSNPSTNTYDKYEYVVNTNHESTDIYKNADNPMFYQNSVQSSNENQNSLYDLSSIYGIKASVDQLSKYKTQPQSNAHQNYDQNNHGDSSPLDYGLTSDIHSDSGTSGYTYNVNTIHENFAENNLQNSGYGVVSNNQKESPLDQNQLPLYSDNGNNAKIYDQIYNLVQNCEPAEPQYYSNEIETKNNANSNDYYSNINTSYESLSQHDTNSGYGTRIAANSGYSDQYSGDLATSDGSALGNSSPVVPYFGPFSSVPITESTTLASLAQMMASLPYQYTYENPMQRNS